MADTLVPYFQQLGIKTIYASPIFKAVPGSLHGYDVVNPYEINPEIGSLSHLMQLTTKLKAAGIGWIQDIVPNHMAYHQSNPWLWDVLEKGSMSVYADFFDVTWSGDFYKGRLMAPFLAGSIEDVIREGKLKLVVHQHKLCFVYGDQYYPLNSRSYGIALANEAPHENLRSFLDQLDQLHHITDHVQYALRWHELLLQFAGMVNDMHLRQDIEHVCGEINSNTERLEVLTDAQFYRLCHWNETDQQINYRRFFLVNGLICLNMQSEKVFRKYHEFIHQLINQEVFQGLRVDHIDGLFDPIEYMSRLRALCGPDCYIVVEKILEVDEDLQNHWPIQGTTGYEFLSWTNNIFTRTRAENKFNSLYKPLAENSKSIPEQIQAKKEFILTHHMQGELTNLHRFFLENHYDSDSGVTADQIKSAIAEFLIQMPVYRFYGNAYPLRDAEKQAIVQVLNRCETSQPELSKAIDVLHQALLREVTGLSYNEKATFLQRCMQFSGPLMAKGVEDTLMYTLNRFVGHNEVGDSPESFGITPDQFHAHMIERRLRWPMALSATSTHDTKRGEDVRARLNVLSDFPDEWKRLISEWFVLNQEFKSGNIPDENDEYLIYQTLVGAYPYMDDLDFQERIQDYLVKALREAKRHSNWAAPDEQYESGVNAFVNTILNPASLFMKSFIAFQNKVSDFGIINSLAQTILKFTCPGIPDIYQGTTGWDLSLVDPDNRRAVDFNAHIALLDKLNGNNHEEETELWRDRKNGNIKLWLTRELLRLRNTHSNLFLNGHYIPLELEGRYADNCMAYARRMGKAWVIAAIPLNIARISKLNGDLVEVDWLDTAIVVPPEFPKEWRNVLHDQNGNHTGEIRLTEIFKTFPFAVLLMDEPDRPRNAGVLLSITSLPSPFGIGDLGPAARNFAQFLARAKQNIWQVLPLNPTRDEESNSPYSSYSSMAGNISLISIEDVVELGLLDLSDVEYAKVENLGVVDFAKARAYRTRLLTKAYDNFCLLQHFAKDDFAFFKKRESHWLNDFALFELLKDEYNNADWSSWPDKIKDRNTQALEEFHAKHLASVERVKWMQFIFFTQWRKLRDYCHELDIKIFGDLPFYVSYSSADVWAHRDVFKLDDEGAMLGVAGVPPDYFAESGQLWGMPIFNWSNLATDNYDWIVKRIKKNLELFDIVRLDHFRAFANYWEVPKGELTAVNGKWMDGPGIELFKTLRDQIGSLPFVAEDLGEENDGVVALRSELQLPGMKVLQFAFGNDGSISDHIPHLYQQNFVVYTGTHDNNTTRGWYRKDISEVSKKKLDQYFGRKMNARNISETFIRLAYSSVAKTAIIPMQDILDLGEKSRMNTPSTTKNNWSWRMLGEADDDLAAALQSMVEVFGR